MGGAGGGTTFCCVGRVVVVSGKTDEVAGRNVEDEISRVGEGEEGDG